MNEITPDRFRKLLAKKLNNYDLSVVKSMESQFLRRRRLSPKQAKYLFAIEKRYDNDIYVASQAEWSKAWDAEKEERLTVVSNYYRWHEGGHRFTSTYQAYFAAKKEGKNYIPSKKNYLSITGNKYAQKILTAWFGPGKFGVGGLVRISQGNNGPGLSKAYTDCSIGVSAGWTNAQPVLVAAKKKHTPCVILQENSKMPLSAAANSKIVKILPIGGTIPVDIEERYLIKYRVLKAPK